MAAAREKRLGLAIYFSIGYNGNAMKKGVHPTYFTQAQVLCACGAKFRVGSTKEKLEVEICSNCHPFYTGGKKIIDTAGRVEKFKQRLAKKKG